MPVQNFCLQFVEIRTPKIGQIPSEHFSQFEEIVRSITSNNHNVPYKHSSLGKLINRGFADVSSKIVFLDFKSIHSNMVLNHKNLKHILGKIQSMRQIHNFQGTAKSGVTDSVLGER